MPPPAGGRVCCCCLLSLSISDVRLRNTQHQFQPGVPNKLDTECKWDVLMVAEDRMNSEVFHCRGLSLGHVEVIQ